MGETTVDFALLLLLLFSTTFLSFRNKNTCRKYLLLTPPYTTKVEVDFMTDYNVDTPSDAQSMNGVKNSSNNWILPYVNGQGLCSILSQDTHFQETTTGWYVQPLGPNNVDQESVCYFLRMGLKKYAWMISMNPNGGNNFWYRRETGAGSGKMGKAETYTITSPSGSNSLSNITIVGVLPLQPIGSANQPLHLLVSCTAMNGKVEKAFVLDIIEDGSGFDSGSLVWPLDSDLHSSNTFTFADKNSCQVVSYASEKGGSGANGWLLCVQQGDFSLAFRKCTDPGLSDPAWTSETYNQKVIKNSTIFGGKIFSDPKHAFNTLSTPDNLPSTWTNPLLIQVSFNSKNQAVMTAVDGKGNNTMGDYTYKNPFDFLQVLPNNEGDANFRIMVWGEKHSCDAITVPNPPTKSWSSIDTQQHSIGQAPPQPTTLYNFYSNVTGPIAVYLSPNETSLRAINLVGTSNIVNNLQKGDWVDIDLGISADNILFGQMSPETGLLVLMTAKDGYLNLVSRDITGEWMQDDVVLPDGSFGSAPPKLEAPVISPNYRALLTVTDSLQNPAADLKCSIYCEDNTPMHCYLNKVGISISNNPDKPTVIFTNTVGQIVIDFNVFSLGVPHLIFTTPNTPKPTTVVMSSGVTSNIEGILASKDYPTNLQNEKAYTNCNVLNSDSGPTLVLNSATTEGQFTSFKEYANKILGYLPVSATDSRSLSEVLKSSKDQASWNYYVDNSGNHQFRNLTAAEAAKMLSDSEKEMEKQEKQADASEPGTSAQEMWERHLTEAIKGKLRNGEANPHANDWRLHHVENLAFLEGKGQPYTSHATRTQSHKRMSSKFPVDAAESKSKSKSKPKGFWSWLGGVISAVNDGIAQLASVVVDVATGILKAAFTVVVDGVSWVINGVLSGAQAVVDMFQTAFSILVIKWRQLFNWLSHVFNWDDIKVMANITKGFIASGLCLKDSISSTLVSIIEPFTKMQTSVSPANVVSVLDAEPNIAAMKAEVPDNGLFTVSEIYNVSNTMYNGQIESLFADLYLAHKNAGGAQDKACADVLVKTLPRLKHYTKNSKWQSRSTVRLRHHKKRLAAAQARPANAQQDDVPPNINLTEFEALQKKIIPPMEAMMKSGFLAANPPTDAYDMCSKYGASVKQWKTYSDAENFGFATNGASTDIIGAFTSDSTSFPFVPFVNLLNEPATDPSSPTNGTSVASAIMSYLESMMQGEIYIPILSELYKWVCGAAMAVQSIASFLIAIPTAPAYNLAIKGGMLSTPLSAINQHDVVQDFQNMLGSLMAISSTTQANFATILSKFPTQNAQASNRNKTPIILCLTSLVSTTLVSTTGLLGMAFSLYAAKAGDVAGSVLTPVGWSIVCLGTSGITVVLEGVMTAAAYPWRPFTTDRFTTIITENDNIDCWTSYCFLVSFATTSFDCLAVVSTAVVKCIKLPVAPEVIDFLDTAVSLLGSILQSVFAYQACTLVTSKSRPTRLIKASLSMNGLGGIARYTNRLVLCVMNFKEEWKWTAVEYTWTLLALDFAFVICQNILPSLMTTGATGEMFHF